MSGEHFLSSIQLTKMGSNENTLQNGSKIFVRVLSQARGGEYIVSFAGSRYTVFSQKQLQPGTAFSAQVTIKDGKIFLSPENSSNQKSVQTFLLSNAESLSKLSGFLQELGLKSDSMSLRIVQYFQASGISFDAKRASKARSIALQFPGNEDDAAEIALFLEQKDISADVETVGALLKVIYSNDFGGSGKKKDESAHSNEENKVLDDVQAIDEKSENQEKDDYGDTPILSQLFENATDALGKEKGLLTLINHHATNPSHWIIIPFEYGVEKTKIAGVIRMLLDLDKKSTEKMIISAFLGGKNYTLMVKYTCEGEASNKQRCEIKFCSDTPESIQSQHKLCDLLRTCLPQDLHCTVEYSEKLLGAGIFTVDSIISVVKLDV